MNFSVTKKGNPLDPDLYTWNEENRIFFTNENNLVLDFSGIHTVIFKTGNNCIFKTRHNCTFKTGSSCIFKTGSDCTFDTGHDCTFDTGPDCTFDTGSYCTFDTGPDCTFDTGPNCTFKTGWNCIFNTGCFCIFKTGPSCTFKTGSDCVVIRRDIFEVIKLEKQENHIKLNGYNIPGYKEIKTEHTITIYGKEIKISDESYEELKKQLN